MQANWAFTILRDTISMHASIFGLSWKLTITVDRTMRTRLLAVTFDLLPTTFVACPRHSSPLLGLWLGRLIVIGV